VEKPENQLMGNEEYDQYLDNQISGLEKKLREIEKKRKMKIPITIAMIVKWCLPNPERPQIDEQLTEITEDTTQNIEAEDAQEIEEAEGEQDNDDEGDNEDEGDGEEADESELNPLNESEQTSQQDNKNEEVTDQASTSQDLKSIDNPSDKPDTSQSEVMKSESSEDNTFALPSNMPDMEHVTELESIHLEFKNITEME